jgi:hypothetical protein
MSALVPAHTQISSSHRSKESLATIGFMVESSFRLTGLVEYLRVSL